VAVDRIFQPQCTNHPHAEKSSRSAFNLGFPNVTA
jgi:hypothetical protein